MADNDLSSDDPVAALRRFFGVPFREQTYRNLAYLALAFPLGLAYFVAVTTALSTGAGMLVTLVGVPLVVVTLAAVAGIGGFEARLARWLLGTDAPSPAVLSALRDADLGSVDGILAATKRLLAAPSTWTSLLLVGLKFVFGIVAFVALVTAASVVTALVTMPAFYDVAGVTYTLGPYPVESLPVALAGAGLGVLVGLVALHALNGLARFGGFLTGVLLAADFEGRGEVSGDA